MRRHQHFDNHHIQKPLDQLSNTPHGSSISHINRAGYHHHHPNNSIHHQVWSGVRRFASGFFDSLRVRRIVNELHAKRTLKILIVQNSILQLVSIASLVGLESYSDSHRSSSWSTLDVLFSTFWLFPIGVISIALNSSITENCLHLNGSLQAPISLGKFSISSSVEIIRYLNAKLRSDYHRILILLNYFLFAEGLLLIPFVGFLLSFAFCSVGNSFYCFDPYWLKDGLNLEERLDLKTVGLSFRIWTDHDDSHLDLATP
ncbi:hypothetical protein PTTG_28433 [Puccinia triticina 1-1 BBBD Race 1]|uniref:Uncharacterized protein n=1 Tax=Puccinia triticina (isolate 1-1 / race 1 (BBBD)) TaxID=630390 RepID=A0A180GBZ6_PUCT1|nr:hypothetical protein PTTG_28433 [Puccinia triticina 1-1 BBBD Race 1]